MRSLPVPLFLAALATLASCVNISPRGNTSFSSEPRGARVHVDGRDSGWVTPCMIALDEDEEHVVTFEMDGFAPSEVVLEPLERHGIVSWRQGVNGVKSTIRFPLLLPWVDLFLPLREYSAPAPSRVFVRLRPSGTPSGTQ
jgi:hypothetical protein